MARPEHDIPQAELEILSVLWKIGQGTVRDVLNVLHGKRKTTAYNTVLTLLARLEERGYVTVDRASRAHVYLPNVSKDSVLADRLGGLVEQFAEGQAIPVILQLVEHHDLTADDIRQLRALLSRMEKERKD